MKKKTIYYNYKAQILTWIKTQINYKLAKKKQDKKYDPMIMQQQLKCSK